MRQAPGLKRLADFTLHDVETLRLMLRGGSVVDWHRLNLEERDSVRGFIEIHGLQVDDDRDRMYMDRVKADAISFLRRHFAFAIPKPVERASIEDLLLLAATKGHRQNCACTILKVVHIINHLNGRELLFRLPLSDRDVFGLVEEKVYRIVGTMLSEGFPITEFVGGRKNLDAIYTKLLSKAESTASQVYDKLRFRIVTRTREELLPILLYLSQRMFPFNYIVPNEATNTMFHFRTFCEQHPKLAPMVASFQGRVDDTLTPGDNQFSAPEYRSIQFVTEMPVRLPDNLMALAPEGSEALGRVVFVLSEFQLVDVETEAANESGEASHAAYKARQRQAVFRRLRLGAREPTDPKTLKR